MIEATTVLVELQNKWFPKKQTKPSADHNALADVSIWPSLAEHPIEIARVKEMLGHISADCSYERWRNVVWSVLSTGWGCADQLALDWSQTAPERFSEDAFWTVANSYDSAGKITLGTLIHHAREAGYMSNDVEVRVSTQHETSGVRFKFRTAAEVRNTKPMRWRVKKLLPEAGIGVIFGPSGSGKTFLAFDMGASIALGCPFYGRKVVPCPVVYIALEGGAGVSQRVQAWERHHGQALPDTFRVVTDALSLLNSDAGSFAEDLNAAGLSSGLVIIDTLNQSAPGADENSPSDMGRIISNAMVIQRLTNSLVLLVHHTGKDKTKGPRGHSSLGAALDVAIEVDNKPSGREWGIYKLKDGESGLYFQFKLESIELGHDEDGDSITSCVAVGDLFRVNKPNPPKGKNQQNVLSAIKLRAISSNSFTYEDAVMVAHDAIPANAGKHRKERGLAALNSLITSGHVVRKGDTIEIV